MSPFPVNFPTSLDSFTKPVEADDMDTTGVFHDEVHFGELEALEKIEAEIGITGTPASGSLRHKLENTTAGHNHDGVNSKSVAGGANHNILSATHLDSDAAGVPANAEVLTWETATSKWKSKPLPAHPSLAAHDTLGLATQAELDTHAAAADPHIGYRLEGADHTHQSAGAQAGTLDHGLALTGLLDDDHTQYQKESEKAAASGYASLDAGTKVPTAQLGGAGADSTKFLRGDQSWAVPAGGSGVDRVFYGGFVEQSMAASQTAVQLERSYGPAAGDVAQEGVPILRAGSITGIGVRLTGDRSAGTATFEVFKNGVAAGLSVVIDATNVRQNVATQAAALDTVAANDRVDVRMTTDASWTPTSARPEAFIEITND